MKTLRVDSSGSVMRVTLDRPDVRNAFNETLIAELAETFRKPPAGTRVAVLTGAGTVFCAGADIDWMRRSREYTAEENARDASAMADMLRAVDEFPAPVIARVNGHALGGGAGLLAACDIVIAVDGATFGFTEVRLGLVPSVISAFVLPRIGLRAARRTYLTGERFDASLAKSIGLVDEVVAADALDARVDAIAAEILKCAPTAVAEAKKLIRELSGMTREQSIDHTVKTIARIRVSPEAQEGLSAFLEKRPPRWP